MGKRAFGPSVRSHLKRRVAVAVLLLGAGTFLLLWKGGGSLLLDPGQKEQLEGLLAPVVMADPAAFGGVSDLPETARCEIALRSVLLHDDGRDALLTDDTGRRIVPYTAVEQRAKELFGSDVQLLPQSFGEGNAQYFYNEQDGAFHIPLLAETGYYTPQVQGVRKKGPQRTVYVGYVPSEGWSKKDDEWVGPAPVKFMTFTLTGKEDALQILSMEESSENQKKL